MSKIRRLFVLFRNLPPFCIYPCRSLLLRDTSDLPKRAIPFRLPSHFLFRAMFRRSLCESLSQEIDLDWSNPVMGVLKVHRKTSPGFDVSGHCFTHFDFSSVLIIYSFSVDGWMFSPDKNDTILQIGKLKNPCSHSPSNRWLCSSVRRKFVAK